MAFVKFRGIIWHTKSKKKARKHFRKFVDLLQHNGIQDPRLKVLPRL
jgi:hypothetical protein